MLAHVTDLEGDSILALKLDRKALEIEPNIRPYWFGQLTRLAAVGMLQSFLTLFGDLNERWPRERRMNSIAAAVFLRSAALEDAADLDLCPLRSRDQPEDSARRDDENLAELVDQIEREQKAHSRASAELRLAREATRSKRDDQALAALRRAYEFYPKDPSVALNLAFAMLRDEAWSDAYDLLVSMPAVLPPETYMQRLGSMAFASAGLGDMERAASLFEDVASGLADDANQRGELLGSARLGPMVGERPRGPSSSQTVPPTGRKRGRGHIESPSPELRSIAELYARGPTPTQQ